VAGLAFEQPATPNRIDGRTATFGTDRGAIGFAPPHRGEHLVRCVPDRSQRSISHGVRAAAEMNNCWATAAVQEKGHGFLWCSETNVLICNLVPLPLVA